jgi:undecaprenyl-diphosphatase
MQREQQPTAAEERAIGYGLVASLALSVLALVFFAWLAGEVLEGDSRAFDDAVRTAVHSHVSPGLTTFMRGVTHLGDPLVVVGLCAVGFAAFWYKGWKRGAAWIAVTMAGAVLLDVTLKLAFERERPVPFFGMAPKSYSFPSGHALGAFCFYATLAGLVAHRTRRHLVRVLAGVAAGVLIAVIGFSRIYLGVHYPTDVIAGYAAAAIWVGALVSLDGLRRHRARRRKRG